MKNLIEFKIFQLWIFPRAADRWADSVPRPHLSGEIGNICSYIMTSDSGFVPCFAFDIEKISGLEGRNVPASTRRSHTGSLAAFRLAPQEFRLVSFGT